MESMKKIIAAICMLAAILALMPSAFAEKTYDGYSISCQTGEGFYGDYVDYYTVYHNSKEKNGPPTFYCEGRDRYNNIYTGWDVEISFYRAYENATLEQARALSRYLKENSTRQYKSSGIYCFSRNGTITDVYVWLIDGWDVENGNLDLQELWDREYWMNSDATGLILEEIGYGYNNDTNQYARELGCSFTIIVQSAKEYDFPGIVIGFRFVEGTDDHIVKKYCPSEMLRKPILSSSSPEASAASKPSVEDVRRFGSEITYPKSSSYLDSYETMYVNAPKKHSIYVYWRANGDSAYLRGSYYFLSHGSEVTVLAREGKFSCVIFTTKNGKEHIGWVYTSELVY